MKTIHLGRGLDLPLDAVTQVFALLARRGAGKTYAALKLAEGMLDVHAQVVAIDPVGKWWSLRLAADGKASGYDLPVFGGHHGDLPLEPSAGRLLADLVVDRGVSAVLDVSTMRKGERKQFVTDFAEHLLLRKKRERAPTAMHVFLEESQVFVPQRTQRGEERMLGAFEDLVKLGRNYGIGCTLISQRPQAVNKDALTQAECLLVLQTIGAQERKALREWMREVGVDRSDAIDELPGLAVGEAYLWSPGWLREFRRVRIGKRRTFDASATPTVGGRRARTAAPRKLEDAELAALREAMAEVVERAEKDDPKALRRQVAELRRELERARSAAPVADEGALERARTEGSAAGRALAERVLARWQELACNASAAFDRAVIDLEKARAALGEPVDVDLDALPAARAPRHALSTRPAVPRRAAASGPGDSSLGKGERATLIATAQHANGVTRDQLSVLTGYKRSSRDAYVQRLRTAGLVDVEGGTIRATDAGVAALGSDYEPLPTGPDLRAYWLERLPEGERRVLEVVIVHYPGHVERTDIDDATGYKRSSRDAYIQRLKARKLLTAERGTVRAADELF